MSGWIKLHRKVVESAVFDDALLFRTWTYILLSATHKLTEKIVAGQLVSLQPGQYIISARVLADRLNIDPMTANRHLNLLDKMGCIKREKIGKQGSKITVCKWLDYQHSEATVLLNNTDGNTVNNTVDNTVSNTTTRREEYKEEKNNNADDSIAKLNSVAVNESVPSAEIIKQLDACHFELSTRNIEEFRKLEDAAGTRWVIDAIKIADDRNARNVSFVRKVIQNWQTDGQQTFSREESGEKKNDEKTEREKIYNEHFEEFKRHIPELFEQLGEYPSYEYYRKLKGWEI